MVSGSGRERNDAPDCRSSCSGQTDHREKDETEGLPDVDEGRRKGQPVGINALKYA